MCAFQYWAAAKKAIREGSAELPWDLIKLVGLAIVVLVLGSTMAGNWIRCNFFDANGCLPRLVAEVDDAAIAIEAAKGLEAHYQKVDDFPNNGNNFEYIRYDLVIKNKGRDHVDTMSIQVNTAFHASRGRLLLYGIDTGLEREAKVVNEKNYIFSTLNFDDVNSFTVTEQSKLFFVIAYDKEQYAQKQGTPVVFLIRCEICQQGVMKLTAGDGA